MQRLIVNPAIRVSARRGQVLLWEPDSQVSRPLTALQFQRIGQLLSGVVDPAELAEAECRALCAARILVESVGAVVPSLSSIELAMAPDGVQRMPTHLRLSGNTCLQPGDAGWVAWSSVQNAYCLIPMSLTGMLLAAGEGKAVDDLLAGLDHGGLVEARARSGLAQLLSGRLLLPARAPGDMGSSQSEAVEGKAINLGGGDPWANMRSDGRTPIYFVTHHTDHLPLALGMLRARITTHQDGALLEDFMPLPIVSMDVRGMQSLFGRFGPGVWLFSNYMWSHDYNCRLSAAVKAADPRNLTIHGGPGAPKYERACLEFMQANPDVDIVVRGEGEDTIVDLLGQLAAAQGNPRALDNVAGITFRTDDAGGVMRTLERSRIVELDELPSPYLTNMFDHYGGSVVAAILETNRGCPYACTFCDWGSATQQKIRKFDLARVKSEIEWIGHSQIRVLWIADANFGIFQRDIEIAEHIADTKMRYGYPREVVVNYPKNATDKIAGIVKVFARAGICGQGIISIQTTDPDTLAAIRRDNIKTRKYDELGDIFRSENLPLSTDLMIGLPGATVASFKRDLQYYFDDDVSIKAYRTQLLPNSPMSDPDYLHEHQIRVDSGKFLVSTSSYTSAELEDMLAIWSAFDIADGYSLLRYVLRFLQWEHGIAAVDFVHALADLVRKEPARHPAITWVLNNFLGDRNALGGWSPFYGEISRFAAERFQAPLDQGLSTAVLVNERMMPEQGRRFPEVLQLPHDFAAYFGFNARVRDGAMRRLADYPPARLEITDPYRMCDLEFDQVEQYDNHQVFFELASGISRRRSVPNFVGQTA